MPSSVVSSTLPDLTGQLVGEDSLELLSVIGCGAFGKVYKARDTDSPADNPIYYAVKCMPVFEPDSKGEEMQLKELETHVTVSDHPRIVTLHGCFTSDEHLFMVLDYVSGGDMYDAMIHCQLFVENPALVKQVMDQLLDAVEIMHLNSVFHRDIKVENILCDEDGLNIRLTDFGLATQEPRSSEFGCGTRLYLSPESLCPSWGETTYSSPHSDLWAVAMVLANLISGHHPWDVASAADPRYSAFRSSDSFLEHALEITPEAARFLNWCFREEPSSRPTLQQMRAEIAKIDTFSLAYDPQTLHTVDLPEAVPPPLSNLGSASLTWAVASDPPSAVRSFSTGYSSELDTRSDSSALHSAPPSTPSPVFSGLARPKSRVSSDLNSLCAQFPVPPIGKREFPVVPLTRQSCIEYYSDEEVPCAIGKRKFPVEAGWRRSRMEYYSDEEDYNVLLCDFPSPPRALPASQRRSSYGGIDVMRERRHGLVFGRKLQKPVLSAEQRLIRRQAGIWA